MFLLPDRVLKSVNEEERGAKYFQVVYKNIL